MPLERLEKRMHGIIVKTTNLPEDDLELVIEGIE